ncbi:hypothetical protein OG369_01920 [Streptomyces sp. NBC_01221]|uniref:hypothetical protein n=1 Tax=unclassified Streptomyces TaxID=2593676 RepID=UPI0022579FD4|nr:MULTISPECIES: hypothetical protein [unclassified Streptomyces]WSP53597.1 hypothetical protein OG306_03750 [Streptomyces sp. NBC_01241]WSU25736.1 hypothetical protein OG508_35615 [Streptomyces sp. NBC_01108]MCX4784987.1 hypothetical protein [Streptomyces sp. NBC_01221]MCX4799075.1 hypothetical protein [Streptomyces sp. NBC_01242]WSJ40262.1 hypothetical protein OG772_32580 [Streptomyces sp. NBC_01321]
MELAEYAKAWALKSRMTVMKATVQATPSGMWALSRKAPQAVRTNQIAAPLALRRPAAGIAPQFAEELATLAMMQATLGFTSEVTWPDTPALSGPAIVVVALIHRPRQRVDRVPGRRFRPGTRSVAISDAG